MTKRTRRWHPIGQWLKTARKDAGLTFAELERLTGISSSSLVRFESNRAVPNFGDVCHIAQQLSWPLVYFATGRERTGHDSSALAVQLHYWGLRDLSLPRRVLFGEIRPFEDLIAEVVTADPSARVLEAIPGLFLRNNFDATELLASGRRYGNVRRLGWLADISHTISRRAPSEYIHPDVTKQLRIAIAHAEKEPPLDEIDYVFGETLSPASRQRAWSASPSLTRRWRIACDIAIDQFQQRAVSILETPNRS